MTSSTITQQSSTSKIEASWEQFAAGQLPESAWRTAYRLAVQEIAQKAKDVLKDSHGRIDSAVKIVLAGDVKLLIDGTAKVASQSNGTVTYYEVDGQCQCKDFPKAPANFCKHRLAFGIAKRATALAKDRLADQSVAVSSNGHRPEKEPGAEASSTPEVPHESAAAENLTHQEACIQLPEAPASCNVYVTVGGHRLQITLRDQDEERLLARMQKILDRFPATQAETPAPAQPAELPGPEGWCRRHDLQMDLQRSKDQSKPGTWFSHRLPTGEWCRGK
jgi:hypothetical protein